MHWAPIAVIRPRSSSCCCWGSSPPEGSTPSWPPVRPTAAVSTASTSSGRGPQAVPGQLRQLFSQAPERPGPVPSRLVGVGAAAVDFQVGTGRMPLAGPSAPGSLAAGQFNEQQISCQWPRTWPPSPLARPFRTARTRGRSEHAPAATQLFKVNCAMCHNFAGSGGALTRGKYAPSLRNVSGKHIYEAMPTGPAVDAGVQRPDPGPDGPSATSSPTCTRWRRREPAASTWAPSARSGRPGRLAARAGSVIGATVWIGAKAS